MGARRPGAPRPLVRRPRLSRAAACALSDFVATHLLGELARRADLPPELADELKQRLAVRLQHSAPPAPGWVPTIPSAPEPNLEEAMWEAHALANRDQVDEAALLAAVQRGEARMATALLAVAADVPAAVVERAATLRSAKALVSLVWRAGFSMAVAGPVQSLLARIPPAGVLRAGPGGAFPLTTEEMRWQIDFLMRK